MAPRARFELVTLRLTDEASKNLSALSGVAYKKLEAIFPALAAPNPAPKTGKASKRHSRRNFLDYNDHLDLLGMVFYARHCYWQAISENLL